MEDYKETVFAGHIRTVACMNSVGVAACKLKPEKQSHSIERGGGQEVPCPAQGTTDN